MIYLLSTGVMERSESHQRSEAERAIAELAKRLSIILSWDAERISNRSPYAQPCMGQILTRSAQSLQSIHSTLYQFHFEEITQLLTQ